MAARKSKDDIEELNIVISQGDDRILPSPSGEDLVVVESAAAPPTMEEIIQDKRRSPFSREDFLSFLKKRHIEENLEFVIDINAFLDRFVRNIDPSKQDPWSKVVRPMPASATPLQAALAISDHYVAEGSPSQVNVSASQRNAVLSYLKSPDVGSGPFNLGIFDQVLDEITKLLESNAYRSFVDMVSSMNISTEESLSRLRTGIAFVLFTAAALAVLIYFEFAGAVDSHWYRLTALPLIWHGIDLIESYRTRICYVCAYLEISTVSSDYTIAETRKRGPLAQVQDAFASSKIWSLGKKLLIRSSLVAMVLMGAVLAIPPYGNL